MSKKSIKQFTDLSNKILDGVLKLFGYTFILLLAVIIILYLAFSIWLGNIRDEQNAERLLQSQNYDRQTFPYLAEHVFFYKRMHVGDSGNWVVVYPLDALTKKEFLLQYRNQENQPQSHQIECIKPTIKNAGKVGILIFIMYSQMNGQRGIMIIKCMTLLLFMVRSNRLK